MGNFSNFSFHENLIWTIANILKQKIAKSVQPFSSVALTNEQNYIFSCIDNSISLCFLFQELREGLEDQIAELSEKEVVVKKLRTQEDREKAILQALQLISCEREREHARLVSERDSNIVNMGLHKYKLKRKVMSVVKEIELDLLMLDKIRRSILKVNKDKCK